MSGGFGCSVCVFVCVRCVRVCMCVFVDECVCKYMQIFGLIINLPLYYIFRSIKQQCSKYSVIRHNFYNQVCVCVCAYECVMSRVCECVSKVV